MKKFLKTFGAALLLSGPMVGVTAVTAQDEVSREEAIQLIQAPVDENIYSYEEAEALLAEWEALTQEVGDIGDEEDWILPEYMPEDLQLAHAGEMQILAYLDQFIAGGSEEESGSESESESAPEESESNPEETSSEEESSDSSDEESNEEEVQEDPLADYPEYRKIIDLYAGFITNFNPEDIPNAVNFTAIEQAANEDYPRVMQYALYDINGDGVEELLQANDDQLFQIYTTDGQEIHRYFFDDTLAERSYLDILDNGNLLVEGSGGAEFSGFTLYEVAQEFPEPGETESMDDAQMAQAVDSMMYDGINAPEGTPYYREEEPETYYTQEEFEEQFGLTDAQVVDISTLDWYPVVRETGEDGGEQGDETGAFDPDAYPYGVDIASLGEGANFSMESVNAPSDIYLDPVNGTVTISMGDQLIGTYSATFDYVDAQPLRVFSSANPGEIREVQANTRVTLNEFIEGDRDDYAGQEYYLFYNDQGGLSLATYNFAGNVEEADADVMLEYLQ